MKLAICLCAGLTIAIGSAQAAGETKTPTAKVTPKPAAPATPGANTKPPVAEAPVKDACVAQIVNARNAAPDAPVSTSPGSTDQDAAYLAYDQGKFLTALALAEAAASKGNPQAHTLVARIHDEGRGIPRDTITAARWYARGAELCDVAALFAYGLMLAEGRGVGKDRALAGEMLEKAAISGHALANYNLGLLFLRGDGKPENAYRAAQHILYAAEKGVAAAQYDIGTMYQAGSGVPNDGVQAARWLNRAAAAGYTDAQYDYAVMLLKGLGLEKDKPKAIEYLTAAADKGLPGAQNRLAHLLHDGIGIDKNAIEAAKWRTLAKAGGVVDDALDAELAKLSKADLASAKNAVADWQEQRALPGQKKK